MLGKPKKYIVTFSQVNPEDIDLVGEKIQKYRRAEQSGINVPIGFIVTTSVFDDFLTANDLISFIAPRINEVDLTNKKVARKSGQDIQRAIMRATIPKIIREPLLKAYNNLSGHTKSFVQMRTSFPSIRIDESNYGQENIIRDVSGEEVLLENLKQLWASLFAPEALQYRANINYEGYLTTAILIQKLVQAEVSGKIFTTDQSSGDLDKIEVTSIYGNYNPDKDHELNYDSYVGEKKTEQIVEKRIVGQSHMYVRKHGTKGKNPILKVNLSKAWNKKQKLDDKYIINLMRVGQILEDLFKHPQEIDYVVESGRVYVYDFKTIDNVEVALASQLQNITNKLSEKKAQQDVANKQIKNTSDQIVKKDISAYVQEIQAMQDIEADQDESGDQVTITLDTIDNLVKIAKGNSVGDYTNYGLLHFIYTEKDWVGLTGDEILVIENIDITKLRQINAVRGVICSSEVGLDIINRINTPIIYNASDVFEKLHENEVITIDGASGGIFLGAGKKSQKIINKLDNNKKLNNTESIKVNNELSTTNIDIKEEPILTNHGHKAIDDTSLYSDKSQITSKTEFKFEVIKVKNSKSEILKSTSNFLQIIDFDNPVVDVTYADGVYIDLTQLYIKYDISITKLSNSKFKRHFIEEFIIMINDLASELKGKPIVISSGDIQQLKTHFEVDKNTIKLSLLMVELELISVLRNRESFRSVWYSLSNVKSAEDQIEQKKIISTQGLRRSSTFKLNVNLDNMLSALMINTIVDSGIDGVIIDLDQMISAIYQSKQVDDIDEEVIKFIGWMVRSINKNSAKVYIKHTKKLNQKFIESLTKKGWLSFILPISLLPDLKQQVVLKEAKLLDVPKKRGRKKKKINYGF